MDGPILRGRRKIVEVFVTLLFGIACEQAALDQKVHSGTDALGTRQPPGFQDIACEGSITIQRRSKQASHDLGRGKMCRFPGKGATHGESVDEPHQGPQTLDPEASLGGGLEQDAVGILHRDRLRANATH